MNIDFDNAVDTRAETVVVAVLTFPGSIQILTQCPWDQSLIVFTPAAGNK